MSRKPNWIISPEKFLNDSEIAMLTKYLKEKSDLAKARGSIRPRIDGFIIRLLLQTGLRVTSACTLKISNIHLKQKRLTVKAKGNKNGVIPISSSLAQAIHEYVNIVRPFLLKAKDKETLLLCETGKPYNRRSLYMKIRAIMTRAGLPREKCHPHILRHTYCCMLYKNTRDLRLCQRMLMHANIQTTTAYSHVLDEDAQAAIEDTFHW